MINVALVGYGYWGQTVARALKHSRSVRLCVIYDTLASRRAEAAKAFPDVKIAKSYRAAIAGDIDAVFIITPPEMHYEMAKSALKAGKHVFVEKPATTRLKHAYDLVNCAEKMGRVLFVDHVFLYSEPVKYLKSLVDAGRLGDIFYINANRINLGLFQYKVDVIWDLAIHDISIIDYLVGFDIKKVAVYKKKYRNFPREAIAHIDADLKNGTAVHINVSWLSPVKSRQMIFGGSEKMVVYDHTAKHQIQIYDHGVVLKHGLDKKDLYESLVQYRIGRVSRPKLPKSQALDNAIEHFADCVATGAQPLSGKQSIINTIQALELISKV